jgi:hypothetical protein
MHKKILVLVLALLLVSVGLVSAQSGNLPGSGWWSGQQIQNVGTASTSVLFTAYDGQGNDFPCGPAKTAGVGQSVNFLTNTECTVPAGFVGSAVVSADQPIAAIVNVVNMPSGRAAGMYRGTDGADVANTIAFPLMKNNYFGRSTTLYIQNASSSANTITVTVKVGAATHTKVFNAVPASAMVLVGPADTTPAMANNSFGSATVTGTGALAGAALEYQNAVALGSNLHAYTAFGPQDFAAKAYCPLVRSNFAQLNTGIQAQNLSATAQDIRVTYSYRINNTGAVQTKVVTLGPIAPNAAATFRTWDDLPARSVGGATVEGVSGGNIAVIVNDETFTLNPNRVTAYTCFPDQAKTNKVNLPLFKEYYLGDTSGVQVQNVGAAAANITVTYYPPGNPAGVKFTQSNIAPGASATFYNVSGGTATSGNAASLLGTFGGAVVEANQPVVAIVNEEPGTKTGARPASTQDAKLYEGFNQ